jgi:hypothetical protein
VTCLRGGRQKLIRWWLCAMSRRQMSDVREIFAPTLPLTSDI